MILLYQAVQILYWLVLSAWFGSLVFLVLAAPIVFRTVRKLEVRSGLYSDPSLQDEQTTIVAGDIVGAVLARLAQLQMVCAIALLPLMIAQLLLINLAGSNLVAAALRISLLLITIVLLHYEWRAHYPRTWRLRQEFLNNTDDPDAANTAREAFEKEHRRSEQMFLVTICLLIGLVMLSANITPRSYTSSPVPSQINPE